MTDAIRFGTGRLHLDAGRPRLNRSARRRTLCVLLLALLPACTPGDAARAPAAPEARAALTVEVAAVEARATRGTLTAIGTVTPWRELTIGAQLNGLAVVEMAVDAGDRVEQGQLLLRLDDAVLRTQIAQQDAAIAEAEANLENAEQEQDRADTLIATRAISQQTVDTRKTTVKTARAKRDAAKAALAQLQAQLAQTEVRAPAGGLVSARSVDVGQVVSLGTELVRIIRDNRLQVDARVPEGDLALVKEGGEVEVTGPDGTATPAIIRQIAPVIDATTRLVVVHIDLPQGTALKSGMFARVGLKGAADRALAVPRSALVWRTGKAHVFLLAEGRTAVLTPVETGRQADGHVEIRAGLSAGDVVVTRGAGLLSNGDHVQVVASATPASGEGTPR